jgi:hypothetical protein
LYLAAASRRDRLHDNFLASERELAETDPSDVSFDLLTQTYLDNKSEYERADSNAALENYRAQSAWDWWQHLQGDDE